MASSIDILINFQSQSLSVLTNVQQQLNQVGNAAQNLNRNFTNLTRGVTAFLGAFVGGVSIASIVREFAEFTQGQQRLAAQIERNKNLSSEAADSFRKQREELASLGIATQGEIANTQGRLTQIGLTEGQIKKVTAAVLELSRQSGDAADSIAEKLQIAFATGRYRSLKEYGLTATNGSDILRQLEAINPQENINKFQALANSLKDLIQQVGNTFNTFFGPVLKGIAYFVSGITDALSLFNRTVASSPLLRAITASIGAVASLGLVIVTLQGLIWAINTLTAVMAAARGFQAGNTAGQALGGLLNASLGGAANGIATLIGLTARFALVIAAVYVIFKAASAFFDGFVNVLAGVFGSKLASVQSKIDKFWDYLSFGFDFMFDNVKASFTALGEFIATLFIRLGEEIQDALSTIPFIGVEAVQNKTEITDPLKRSQQLVDQYQSERTNTKLYDKTKAEEIDRLQSKIAEDEAQRKLVEGGFINTSGGKIIPGEGGTVDIQKQIDLLRLNNESAQNGLVIFQKEQQLHAASAAITQTQLGHEEDLLTKFHTILADAQAGKTDRTDIGRAQVNYDNQKKKVAEINVLLEQQKRIQALATAEIKIQTIKLIEQGAEIDTLNNDREAHEIRLKALQGDAWDAEAKLRNLTLKADEIQIKKLEELIKWYEKWGSVLGDTSLQVARLKDELAKAKEEQAAHSQQLSQFSALLVNDIGSGFDGLIDGTKSLSEAFSDMAKSIITDITKILAKAALMQVIGTLFNPGGPLGGIGNLFGNLQGQLSGGFHFASGGIVPGPLGAGDIVPAMLSPGEVVMNGSQQSMFAQAAQDAGNSRRETVIMNFSNEADLQAAMASNAGKNIVLNHITRDRLKVQRIVPNDIGF